MQVILVSRQPSENSDWNGIYKRGIPRQILNEASLWAGLQEDALAARRLVLGRERMTFAEQITSFHEAAVLVHKTGAAMAGALFMQPGTVFLALHAYDTHPVRGGGEMHTCRDYMCGLCMLYAVCCMLYAIMVDALCGKQHVLIVSTLVVYPTLVSLIKGMGRTRCYHF